MHIVYVADENYMRYVEKSAQSLLKIHPDALITVVSPRPVETKFENVVIDLQKYVRDDVRARVFKRRSADDRISETTYLKLFLTELPYDKVICLDGDTIVQKPLDELWAQKVRYIGLCESYAFGQKQAEDLGLQKYGLSGMMLMNLENLRKIKFTQKCLNVTAEVSPWCHEETLINVAMNGKLKFLPVKWNYCHNRDYAAHSIKEEDAAILHICGKDKTYMDYEPYSEIRQVKKYIEGKSVAVVGNAKSIFDKANGPKIDAHDVVIRFNKGLIIKPESQGKKTSILLLACELSLDEKASYKAWFSINRSTNTKCGDLTISNRPRAALSALIGRQPTTGLMAIDLCVESKAKSIDLYGFDFEATPTFYNPEGYVTPHDYDAEEKIVRDWEKRGLLKIN